MTYVPALGDALPATPTTASPAPHLIELARARELRVLRHHCEAGDHSAAGEHPCLTLTLVQHGGFAVHRDRHTHLLAAGSWLIGRPGEPYRFSHDYGGDSGLSYQFPEQVWDELQAQMPPGAGRMTLPPALTLEATAMMVAATHRNDAFGIAEAGYRLLAEALTQASMRPAAQRPASQSDRDRAFAAASFFNARHAEPVALADVAAHVGLSPFELVRVCRRALGLTPHQYLIRTRLRAAMTLLRETSQPVTEVALHVGFGDLSHFHHSFRAQLGCTPRQYRQAS